MATIWLRVWMRFLTCVFDTVKVLYLCASDAVLSQSWMVPLGAGEVRSRRDRLYYRGWGISFL